MTHLDAPAMLELLPEPFLFLDASGAVTWVNPAAAQWFGRERGALVGLRLEQLGAAAADVTRALARWTGSRSLLPARLSFRAANGEARSVRCDGAVAGFEKDARTLLIRFRTEMDRFTALTDRLQAVHQEAVRRIETERALEAEQKWFLVTLRSIGDGVIATDVKGRVRFVNAAAERFTGWAASDAVGQPLSEVFQLLNEDTRAVVESPVVQVLREGVVVGLANHTLLVRKDGTELAIADSAAPILSDSGDLLGVVLVFQDESKRRANEAVRKALLEQERSARQHAETASRLKDEFLATLSHELRTPLAAILGWADVLKEEGRNAAQLDHAVEVIVRNARTQLTLVNELLDTARVTSGRVELSVDDVNLGEVVQHAVDSLVHAAASRGVILRYKPAPEQLYVRGDALRLQQAVWNLVTNAVKFTPRGGQVLVTTEQRSSRVVICVQDQGIGLSDEAKQRLFEPFWQADAKRTGENRGLGLGLPLVARIMEAHGGDVHVHSEGPGRGSQFELRLPVPAVMPGRATPPGAERSLPLVGVKVLVVEDDRDARDALVSLLTLKGGELRSAPDASAALTTLDEWQPDVILSDLAMPGMDGAQFIKTVRARTAELGGSVPAIALTAFVFDQDATRALKAGFDKHLGKPARLRDIVSQILELVHRPSSNVPTPDPQEPRRP